MTVQSLREPWHKRLAEIRRQSTTKDTIPQELANGWTDTMTMAVRFFHEPDFVLIPAVDYVDSLSDSEVEQRIASYQQGYDKEYYRQQMILGSEEQDQLRYNFSELPVGIQRSVVSHWDSLHYEWLEKHGVQYTYKTGYHWMIKGTSVPYMDMDEGKIPTEVFLLQFETIMRMQDESSRDVLPFRDGMD